MATAIIPLAASLLPILIPEVKSLIQLVEHAFSKKPPSPNPDVIISPPPPSPSGQAKMDLVTQLVQALLGSLNGSGLIMPDRSSIQGFIEGLFQDMKAAGLLTQPLVPPAPAPNSNLQVGWAPNVQVVSLNGKPVIILP